MSERATLEELDLDRAEYSRWRVRIGNCNTMYRSSSQLLLETKCEPAVAGEDLGCTCHEFIGLLPFDSYFLQLNSGRGHRAEGFAESCEVRHDVQAKVGSKVGEL